ncbi:MAG: helix-turn-helix transcriptional regulator [Parachlamydiaceae bacterium]|nr:helix-turn-helix transcriptional regulator [Parachlamydiaceae bacterium]
MSCPSLLQQQLRQRLKDKGLSANALEKRSGLKASAVQNILQGKSRQPAATLLQTIATELDCSVADLLGETPKKLFATTPEVTSHEWNSKMYIETLHFVEKLLLDKNIDFSKELLLKYANEVYEYSMKGGQSGVDKHFATWLIDQYPFHCSQQ